MSENRGTAQPAGAGIFSAAELRHRMADREAAKAAEEARHLKEQEEKQKAVMAEFHKPPERTPEQLMQLVNRAAERGQSEVQVYRFPNALCSDRGRRIIVVTLREDPAAQDVAGLWTEVVCGEDVGGELVLGTGSRRSTPTGVSHPTARRSHTMQHKAVAMRRAGDHFGGAPICVAATSGMEHTSHEVYPPSPHEVYPPSR